MYNDVTNLLPPAFVRMLRRRYFGRLVVIVIVVVAFLLAAAAALLFPVHQYLLSKIATDQFLLKDATSNQVSAEDTAFEARLSALTQNTSRITALTSSFSLSSTLRNVLTVTHAGVTISALSVAAPGKGPGQVTITGLAATRDALRSYQLAFEGAPFIAAANLPVSVYAKDKDISFTMTLLLTTP